MGTLLRNIIYRLRGQKLRLYLGLFYGCSVGSGLKCRKWPILRNLPRNGNIKIGKNANIGYFITFEVTENGKIEIGDNVDLTHNVLIASNTHVKIGNNCLFAENVSIRDSSHGTAAGTPINQQASDSEAVTIGNDVWLGAGSQVLMGSKVPDGVVIGAQSIVNRKSELKADGIYAGTPVSFIKMRS